MIPESENRYLKANGTGLDNLVPILSDKGIGIVGFLRPAREFPLYQGTPEYITEEELRGVSYNTKEASVSAV